MDLIADIYWLISDIRQNSLEYGLGTAFFFALLHIWMRYRAREEANRAVIDRGNRANAEHVKNYAFMYATLTELAEKADGEEKRKLLAARDALQPEEGEKF